MSPKIDADYFTSTISHELGIYVQFKAIPIRITLQNVPSLSELKKVASLTSVSSYLIVAT